jgi:thiosulfate/3-mercaptopyruvate sulfurtransferase
VALVDVPTLAAELATSGELASRNIQATAGELASRNIQATAGELASRNNQTTFDPPTVIDVRWRLGGPPGRDEYVAGHVPGASFLDLDRDLSGQPGAGGRHPLPEPHGLEAALRGAGVRSGHPVVAYDAGDGQAAARLWWTLRWAGHENVRVLDGGYAAWVAAAGPIETGEPPTRDGDIVVAPGRRPVLDADAAEELAHAGVLIDARIGPRYRGETEPVDPVAGHIPGAVNLPAAQLGGPDGRLLPAERLRQVFADIGVRSDGAAKVGAYCGSGVTAAHTVLALSVAGIDDAALYVGSWSNWVDDPLRPIASGDNT